MADHGPDGINLLLSAGDATLGPPPAQPSGPQTCPGCDNERPEDVLAGLDASNPEEDRIRASRRRGIGASQVAALPPFNCHDFITRYDVYAGALGLAKDTPPHIGLTIGHLLEDDMLDLYRRTTGVRPEAGDGALYSLRGHPHIICHPDALLPAGKGIEFKVAGIQSWRNWGPEDGQVPAGYYLQCQHSMLVCNRPFWDLCVLIGTEFRIYELRANPEIQAAIVQACDVAWADIERLRAALANESTKAGAAAELSAMAAHDEDAKAHMLQRVFPQMRGDKRVPCPTEHLGWFKMLLEQQEYAKAAEHNVAELKNRFRLAIGEDRGWNDPNSGCYVERRRMKNGGTAVVIGLDKEHRT